MKTEASIPSSRSTHSHPSHCTHKSRSGRRCRFSVADPASSLCFKHASRRRKDHSLADFASTLTRHSEEFQTAAGVNQSLAELYKLLAQDRISPRRAAVLAYISNLLLRTLTAMDREANLPYDESNPPQSDFTGIPRPAHNLPRPQDSSQSCDPVQGSTQRPDACPPVSGHSTIKRLPS